MTRLSLSLLGSFQVSLDDEPVTAFATDKARALLAYLALETDYPHRRDVLAGLLWPDQPQQKARQNLRQALSNLRRAIADRDKDAPFLLVERETVQFNPDCDHELDVTTFSTLLDACQAHPHRRLPTCRRCMEQLEQAANLYRGSFLEGFFLSDSTIFEEWAVLKREWLHRMAGEAFLRLSDCHERRGEHAKARHYAWRQVELDPWREEAHRQLMRLLAFDGQRSAALAQYETCRRVLAKELSVEPTSETTALYERVKAGAGSSSYPRPPVFMHNLPPSPTPFVGREKELAELADVLVNPGCRLLSLVGPGGIGKTRLALQAAADQVGAFAHGIYYVPLASVHSVELVIPAIADALKFPFYGRQPPKAQLLDYLREKEMLLVLDNLEHLLEGVGLMSEALQRAPGVVFLTTSRERLNLREEWVYEVEGLTYPKDRATAVELSLETIESYSALDLFAQSARRAHSGFSLERDELPFVVDVCHMVGGTPLGVELAAAWSPVCTCQEIAQEIARSLDFLASTQRQTPERHRSLRAVFQHSWRLLSEQEQAVFSRLSVFRGGFGRQAASQVAGASLQTLMALVDKSLLRHTSEGRYQVHELLRQYAAEKAPPQEQKEARTLHSRHYAAFLQAQEKALQGQDQREALHAIGVEIDNVRGAWDWAAARSELATLDQGLDALARFYFLRGPFQVGKTLIKSAVEAARAVIEMPGPPAQDAQTTLGRLLVEQTRLLIRQARYDQAIGTAQAALELVAQAGDGSVPLQGVEAAAHLLWGRALWRQGNYEIGQNKLKQALDLARAASLWQIEADSLRNLGSISIRQGDYAQARLYGDQALHAYREIGDRRGQSSVLNNLGTASYYQGDYARTWIYYDQARQTYVEIGDRRGESKVLNNVGNFFADRGDYSQAQDYYERALRIHREIGSRMGESVVLNNRAGILWSVGDYVGARHDYERALRLAREIGDRQGEGIALSNLSQVTRFFGDDETALDYGQRALLIAQELGDRLTQGDTLARIGHAQAGLGRLEAAIETHRQTLELRRELGQSHRAMESLASLARVFLAQDDVSQARAQVEEVLRYLETNTLDGADEPFHVYLTCYRVLRASQDPHAPAILAAAHDLLLEWAARIGDDEQRRSFLEDVAVHREIVNLAKVS